MPAQGTPLGNTAFNTLTGTLTTTGATHASKVLLFLGTFDAAGSAGDLTSINTPNIGTFAPVQMSNAQGTYGGGQASSCLAWACVAPAATAAGEVLTIVIPAGSGFLEGVLLEFDASGIRTSGNAGNVPFGSTTTPTVNLTGVTSGDIIVECGIQVANVSQGPGNAGANAMTADFSGRGSAVYASALASGSGSLAVTESTAYSFWDLVAIALIPNGGGGGPATAPIIYGAGAALLVALARPYLGQYGSKFYPGVAPASPPPVQPKVLGDAPKTLYQNRPTTPYYTTTRFYPSAAPAAVPTPTPQIYGARGPASLYLDRPMVPYYVGAQIWSGFVVDQVSAGFIGAIGTSLPAALGTGIGPGFATSIGVSVAGDASVAIGVGYPVSIGLSPCSAGAICIAIGSPISIGIGVAGVLGSAINASIASGFCAVIGIGELSGSGYGIAAGSPTAIGFSSACSPANSLALGFASAIGFPSVGLPSAAFAFSSVAAMGIGEPSALGSAVNGSFVSGFCAATGFGELSGSGYGIAAGSAAAIGVSSVGVSSVVFEPRAALSSGISEPVSLASGINSSFPATLGMGASSALGAAISGSNFVNGFPGSVGIGTAVANGYGIAAGSPAAIGLSSAGDAGVSYAVAWVSSLGISTPSAMGGSIVGGSAQTIGLSFPTTLGAIIVPSFVSGFGSTVGIGVVSLRGAAVSPGRPVSLGMSLAEASGTILHPGGLVTSITIDPSTLPARATIRIILP